MHVSKENTALNPAHLGHTRCPSTAALPTRSVMPLLSLNALRIAPSNSPLSAPDMAKRRLSCAVANFSIKSGRPLHCQPKSHLGPKRSHSLDPTRTDRHGSSIDADSLGGSRDLLVCVGQSGVVELAGDAHTIVSLAAVDMSEAAKTYSAVRSAEPIRSMSTPGTSAIELLISAAHSRTVDD